MSSIHEASRCLVLLSGCRQTSKRRGSEMVPMKHNAKDIYNEMEERLTHFLEQINQCWVEKKGELIRSNHITSCLRFTKPES